MPREREVRCSLIKKKVAVNAGHMQPERGSAGRRRSAMLPTHNARRRVWVKCTWGGVSSLIVESRSDDSGIVGWLMPFLPNLEGIVWM